jgi:hypothetical protein
MHANNFLNIDNVNNNHGDDDDDGGGGFSV